MKKIILSAALAFSSIFAIASGTKEKSIASYRTVQNLAKEFGDVENLKWSSASNNMTRADFTVDDQKISAFFDEAGEYVASTKILTVNNLPKKILTSLNKKLEGATITSVIHMTTAEDSSYFIESELNGVKKVWKGYSSGMVGAYKVQ